MSNNSGRRSPGGGFEGINEKRDTKQERDRDPQSGREIKSKHDSSESASGIENVLKNIDLYIVKLDKSAPQFDRQREKKAVAQTEKRHPRSDVKRPVVFQRDTKKRVSVYWKGDRQIKAYKERGRNVLEYKAGDRTIKSYKKNGKDIKEYKKGDLLIKNYREDGKNVREYKIDGTRIKEFKEGDKKVRMYKKGDVLVKSYKENGKNIREYKMGGNLIKEHTEAGNVQVKKWERNGKSYERRSIKHDNYHVSVTFADKEVRTMKREVHLKSDDSTEIAKEMNQKADAALKYIKPYENI